MPLWFHITCLNFLSIIRMPKPRLPEEIARKLPADVVHIIHQFVSVLPSPKYPSPQLQRELARLQAGNKKTSMYLRDLDDFVLDKQ